jgi:hypothetical protein
MAGERHGMCESALMKRLLLQKLSANITVIVGESCGSTVYGEENVSSLSVLTYVAVMQQELKLQ